MSASAPRQTGSRNPAKKFIKWKGARLQGWFEYYDKDIEDKAKRNVIIDLSEGFWILDSDLFSVTGYDEAIKASIISNEVRTVNDKLVVKKYKDKKAQVILEGSYSEIKPFLKANDCHYTKSIYIKLKSTGEVAHLAIGGSVFREWLGTVEAKPKFSECLIRHAETKDAVKGSLEYRFPVFEVGALATEDEWNEIVKDDAEIVQPYLKQYFTTNGTSSTGQSPEESDKQLDTSKWREHLTPSGKTLAELTFADIMDISEFLVENGQGDSDYYSFIGHALYDYQEARKVWEAKSNKDGKKLVDFTLTEIKEAYNKVSSSQPAHPSKIILEVALEAIEMREAAKGPQTVDARVRDNDEWDEDDDIPF